jgi:hypothetical protein
LRYSRGSASKRKKNLEEDEDEDEDEEEKEGGTKLPVFLIFLLNNIASTVFLVNLIAEWEKLKIYYQHLSKLSFSLLK